MDAGPAAKTSDRSVSRPLSRNSNDDFFSKQIQNLKRSESRIFIMNVHSGYARPILKAAQDIGLIGPQYAWVVTDGTINDAVSLHFIRSRVTSCLVLKLRILSE